MCLRECGITTLGTIREKCLQYWMIVKQLIAIFVLVKEGRHTRGYEITLTNYFRKGGV